MMIIEKQKGCFDGMSGNGCPAGNIPEEKGDYYHGEQIVYKGFYIGGNRADYLIIRQFGLHCRFIYSIRRALPHYMGR